MAQDKLVNSPTKSEKIEQHMDKMRQILHKPTLLSPQQKLDLAKEKTKLLVEQERNNKMSMPMQGDSARDFNPDLVPAAEKYLMNEAVAESTPTDDDPIMTATNYQEEKKESKPMQEESFPKFQYSIFVDAQRNAQIVIRANTFEEFKKLKSEADSILTFTTTSANPMAQQTIAPPMPVQAAQPPLQQPTAPVAQAPICGIHGQPMQWKTGVSKKTGRNYAMWSCSGKMQDGSWCNFKPQV